MKHRVFGTLLTPFPAMAIVFALGAALFAALALILTKVGLEKLDPFVAFAVQSVLILVITWIAAFATGNVRQTLSSIDPKTWLSLLGAGIITTFSTLCAFKALSFSDATLVAPIERLSLVFVTILAAVFLKEKLTWPVMLGVGLMTAGAIVIGFAKK